MGMGLSWLMMIVFLLVPNKLLSQSDTTLFNYTIFNQDDPNLIYQGAANVPTSPPGLTFIFLTETDDRIFPSVPFENSVGRIVYSPPIRLWDRAGRRQANFQTRFSGYISNRRSAVMGDGIAFFIAPVNTTIPPGSTDGHLGLYGSSGSSPTPLLAVELDVFPNRWDPDYRHLAININSRESVAVQRWNLPNTGRNVEARITYDARARLITANVYANVSSVQPVNARVEHRVDLKTILPEWVQIGISASTGGAVALHGLDTWSFTSFMTPDHLTHADQ